MDTFERRVLLECLGVALDSLALCEHLCESAFREPTLWEFEFYTAARGRAYKQGYTQALEDVEELRRDKSPRHKARKIAAVARPAAQRNRVRETA